MPSQVIQQNPLDICLYINQPKKMETGRLTLMIRLGQFGIDNTIHS